MLKALKHHEVLLVKEVNQLFTLSCRWYEDLRCTEADKVILTRVQSGETINLPNGKLLERLLVLKMYRENISDSPSYSWDNEAEQRTVDETRAPFFKELLPLAQKKINGIR
jgi:hypothetical protein